MIEIRMNLSNEAAGIATQKIPIKGTALEGTCIPDPDCKLTKYRTIDGSCNNMKNPLMGRSVTQLGRYQAPKYDDGNCFIFTSVVEIPKVFDDWYSWLHSFHLPGVWLARDTGMPNSRLARTLLAPDDNVFQKDTTNLVMQFGQFLDHDITHVPVFQLGIDTKFCFIFLQFFLIN